MEATNCLDSLPFDAFYYITTLLDDRDCISLSRTNRAIRALMTSELIAHKTVLRSLQFSKEGQLAIKNRTGYRKAVGHRFAIHEAIATAAPYSVSVLGYATKFLYSQGFLCYVIDNEIRVLDVHGGGQIERVLTFEGGPDPLKPDEDNDASDWVTLLSFNHGILVFRMRGIVTPPDTLYTIDMDHNIPHSEQGRILIEETLPASLPFFVRNNESYIWYGLRPSMDSRDWLIKGMDVKTKAVIEIDLDDTMGEIDQTLCFEMFDEHLYAVTTEHTTHNGDPKSSFYTWSCIPPREEKGTVRGIIWRRNDSEGPVDELWADLSIQTDEITGVPVILETRREWNQDGGSENHRTCYIHPLPWPGLARRWSFLGWFMPPNCSKYRGPCGGPPHKRLRRDYHAEFEADDHWTKRQEFIPMRTKLHSYHLASNTFIDLVNDPTPLPDGLRNKDRIRLRTVSRKRKSPLDEEGTEGPAGLLFPPTHRTAMGNPVKGSEERFVSRGVHLWPPKDAPEELQSLLCPDTCGKTVRAVADERSIVYSVPYAGLPKDHQALVLISFDPSIRLSGMTPLRKQASADGDVFPIKLPQPKAWDGSLVTETEALYKVIRSGYWLR